MGISLEGFSGELGFRLAECHVKRNEVSWWDGAGFRKVWGGPRWKERQLFLSARNAQAVVVLRTKLVFQILLLPFLALCLMIRATQIVKSFIQVLLGPKRGC